MGKTNDTSIKGAWLIEIIGGSTIVVVFLAIQPANIRFTLSPDLSKRHSTFQKSVLAFLRSFGSQDSG